MHIVLMEVIQSDLCASAVVSPSQETVHWRLELAQYSGRPLRILCSVRGNQEQSNHARSNNGKVTVLMPPLQSPATVPAPVAFTSLLARPMLRLYSAGSLMSTTGVCTGRAAADSGSSHT
jgi:hypothetical protein